MSPKRMEDKLVDKLFTFLAVFANDKNNIL